MTDSARERQLVNVARHALRYFRHEDYSDHAEINLGRELVIALKNYPDVEPVHDADRRMARAQADGWTETEQETTR